MNIMLNGQEINVENNATILDIIQLKNLDENSVVAELDGTIYKTNEFLSTHLKENSKLELLCFVGGG